MIRIDCKMGYGNISTVRPDCERGYEGIISTCHTVYGYSIMYTRRPSCSRGVQRWTWSTRTSVLQVIRHAVH